MRRKQVTDKIKSAGRPLTIALRRGFPLVDEGDKKLANNNNNNSNNESGRRKSSSTSPSSQSPSHGHNGSSSSSSRHGQEDGLVDEEEEERVRDFTSLLIENGQRPSLSVLNQFRAVIGGSFKPWKKKKNSTSSLMIANENRIDEDTDTNIEFAAAATAAAVPVEAMVEQPKPRVMKPEQIAATTLSTTTKQSGSRGTVVENGPIVLGGTASDAAFSKYKSVGTAVGLRPGASVLVQRSSGDWCYGEVLTYDFNTSILSVRVGAMKKKALELNKKKHLAQLKVRPGDILLGTAPDSPEFGSMRKRPSSNQLLSNNKGGTPQAAGSAKGGTPRSANSTPRANVSRLEGGTSSRSGGSSFGFHEEDGIDELDNEFRQRRILYRVGIIGGQYNIAEVYSRSEGYVGRGSDHSEQVSRSALKTEGVFILDCNTEVYVWLGKKATSGIRLAGIQVTCFLFFFFFFFE
jgi:hypothetical protein